MANQPKPAIRPAASVILLRESAVGGGERDRVEVFLLRRRSRASFAPSAFVFPGGGVDPGEDDPRLAATRELFEEAGVLLADRPLDAATRAAVRAQHATGDRGLPALLAEHGAAPAVDELAYYSHWITPSVENKRFSAQFFLARMPAGQTAEIDDHEATDAIWLPPGEAVARTAELGLWPPQLRTLWELAQVADRGVTAVFSEAEKRAWARHPILPRLLPGHQPLTLMLPWDPDYADAGVGDAMPIASDHALAFGPTRFVLEDRTWKLCPAPSSPPAG